MTPAAAEWVDKAENDFQSMSWEMQRTPIPNYDDACFHAQQCIEKLMKAVLTEHGAVSPMTHDLFDLAKRVSAVAPAWSYGYHDLTALMPGAVIFRYPGMNASAQNAQTAIAACNTLRPTLLALL